MSFILAAMARFKALKNKDKGYDRSTLINKQREMVVDLIDKAIERGDLMINIEKTNLFEEIDEELINHNYSIKNTVDGDTLIIWGEVEEDGLLVEG